jgi:hypothetical protein
MQPSGGLGCGAGQGWLDTVWTRVGVGTSKFVPGVPLWGLAGGRVQA